MYVYLYDTFVSQSKYQNIIARIETRLTDLGIAGRICRLSVLTSINELVTDAIKKGIETIVAVGNDETVTKLIPLVAGNKISLGIIPISRPNRIAGLLGIPEGEKACDVLSARVVEKLDLGKANDQYFLNYLEVPSKQIKLNDQYTVKALTTRQTLTIYNFGAVLPEGRSINNRFNPRDGQLEVVISDKGRNNLAKIFKKAPGGDSIFTISSAKIESAEDQAAVADGQTVIKTPVSVRVAKNNLKVIVGRNRIF